MRGTGRAAFTAFLLLFVGTLNIFYGMGDVHSVTRTSTPAKRGWSSKT